jgi:site-specific recombinase XerD
MHLKSFFVKRRSQPTEEHRSKKLLDQVGDAIRLKHYSYRTEQAYVGWIKRYIYFHDMRHPSEMGAAGVEAFLTHLAVKEHVAASTQNQALSALLFLYREVLHQELGPVDALRAKRPKRLPIVLTKDETLRLIGCLSGTHQLMAKLIYGSGIRLMECLRLRVKDLESERRALIVRDGKGAQDRMLAGERLLSTGVQHRCLLRYSSDFSVFHNRKEGPLRMIEAVPLHLLRYGKWRHMPPRGYLPKTCHGILFWRRDS